MIIFKKLRYQNILSTGNIFTEIDFLSHKSTLVVGENGAGKSTFIEALTYCLFGRPFRKINLAQLINSITNKNLLTEVEFSIGSNEYLVRRGMKPNIFKIFINGSEMNSQGSKDDQKYLEETVLKMNFKSFCQIVVLGSTNYIPFMLLSSADRRLVVENLLDIQIFTIMNQLLKRKIDDNSSEISSYDLEINVLEAKIESEKRHLETLRADNKELIENKLNNIKKQETIILESEKLVNEFNIEVDRLMADVPNIDKLQLNKNKLLQFEASIEEKLRKSKKDLEFFTNHDNCPTCKQLIDSNFKNDALLQHECKSNELSDALTDLDAKLKELNDKIKTVMDVQSNIQKINNNISLENQKIRSTKAYITELEVEIETLRTKSTSIGNTDGIIKDLTKNLNEYNIKLESSKKQKDLYTLAGKLLKDTGIKTKIINRYIPIMNNLINQYLSQMELLVEFNLDENFNETIKSRFRDTFSFESFSEGEKMRITLAILFTWRSIAKLRNSASTNLLIMDEVLDSSLDDNGTEEFLRIIGDLTKDTNTFIISHKGDMLYDRFESVIKFEKHSNFSKRAL